MTIWKYYSSVLEIKFWLWMNLKVTKLCLWAGDLAYKYSEYDAMESLYSTAEALQENTAEFHILLKYYKAANPRL